MRSHGRHPSIFASSLFILVAAQIHGETTPAFAEGGTDCQKRFVYEHCLVTMFIAAELAEMAQKFCEKR